MNTENKKPEPAEILTSTELRLYASLCRVSLYGRVSPHTLRLRN